MAKPQALTIGTLARRTGTKVPTIRYYETIGLLALPDRSAGNQRLYGVGDETRLRFIRHARELGFGLGDIRALLELSAHPEDPCAEAHAIASRQLAAVRSRIERLRALETELQRMVDDGCHNSVAQCRVLEVLGDHGLCLHDDHAGPEL